MDISIVIVNYKTASLAVDCIASIFRFTTGINFEIIVVDNNSGDDSEPYIKQYFPSIIWVQTGYNAGFSRANNIGFSLAKGKYLLLLNADTLLIDNVLEKCFLYLENHSDTVAVGAKQYYADGSPMPYYDKFSFRRTFFLFPHTPFFNKLLAWFIPENHYQDPNQVDWLVGACMMVRKTAIAKAGNMDEDFFMYTEDCEWSYRLGKVGKLVYVPTAIFLHLENQTDFRRKNISFVNRFNVQVQVSNFLWVRKQYGVLAYLVLILHYISWILVFCGWKILVNITQFRSPFFQFKNQQIFALKTRVLLKFFWQTLLKLKGFYRVLPEDNIDLRYFEK